MEVLIKTRAGISISIKKLPLSGDGPGAHLREPGRNPSTNKVFRSKVAPAFDRAIGPVLDRHILYVPPV